MKFILERKKATLTVETASHRWASSTAAELADFLRPELADGETLPDLELVQKLFGRALTRRWNRLEAADEAHVAAAARHGLSLAERSTAIKKLYRRVGGLRMMLRGVFGITSARRLLGLEGKTSKDPVILLRQAERIVARLLDARLPATAYEPTDQDRTRWATPVKEPARTLEAAHARASIAAKQLDGAAAERRRAIEDFNDAFARVAGWLAGTYRAAGRDERAAAVKPSGRRPGLLLTDDRRRPQANEQPGPTSVAANEGTTLPTPAEPDRHRTSPRSESRATA